MTRVIRNAAIAILVIGGGVLQFLSTSTRHPSTLLQIWSWFYVALAVFVLAGLLLRGIELIRQRRT